MTGVPTVTPLLVASLLRTRPVIGWDDVKRLTWLLPPHLRSESPLHSSWQLELGTAGTVGAVEPQKQNLTKEIRQC